MSQTRILRLPNITYQRLTSHAHPLQYLPFLLHFFQVLPGLHNAGLMNGRVNIGLRSGYGLYNKRNNKGYTSYPKRSELYMTP